MHRCETGRRVLQSCRECTVVVASVATCAWLYVVTTAFTSPALRQDQRSDCVREPGDASAVDDSPEALMDAADAARSSGHPAAAVMCLRKVLREHSESPLAPLAAFTLGRVLLERLGQPLPAADAFAMARALAPEGSLAQDALAREVEAWSKAGHPQDAYKWACLYVVTYPHGRRLHSVQMYGGLRVP